MYASYIGERRVNCTHGKKVYDGCVECGGGCTCRAIHGDGGGAAAAAIGSRLQKKDIIV